MKYLLIVRHAKSSWDNLDQRDFDRPLNSRGERDAPEMAQRLVAANVQADVVISSPAVRAMTTARYLVEALEMSADDLQQDPEIYEAGLDTLLDVIRRTADAHDAAILVGHNPGLTMLNNSLSKKSISNLSTCGMVHLQLNVDSWADVEVGGAQFLFYDYPKNLSGIPIRE